MQYENYHAHTCYSNFLTQLDSPVFIKDYAKYNSEHEMQTLCVCEHGNRSNAWEQLDFGLKYELKPIVAAEAYFVPDNNPELKDNRNYHLMIVCKNNRAFKPLNYIFSQANINGFYGKARIDWNLLETLNPNDYIITTACIGGLCRDENYLNYCKRMKNMFGNNFYLEIQHHLNQSQINHNKKILDVYNSLHIPLIFGTDSHYINKEDKILRDELLNSLPNSYSKGYDDEFELHIPTPDEAYNNFVQQNVFTRARIEEAMENTLQLREFEGFTFDKTRKFPIAKDKQNLTQEQRNYIYQKLVCDGYIKQFGMPNDEEKKELRKEMDVVINTGSADYFIGLHDMIKRGIELGGVLTTTSRGSACGFVSNAALGLTTINRLHVPVPIYPERFVTADKLKVAMPDIDSNITNVEAFEQAGREIFGEHSCYPMIAYGTNKTLSAFKMLARAKNIEPSIADEISKQISAYELEKKHAIENNEDDPEYDVDEDVLIENYIDKQYLDIIADSRNYQGIIVSSSLHPCAHLVYHSDLREDIGVVSLKPKTGSKERQLCLYIDGITADNYGYCKSDLLRVTVVKLIRRTFDRIGFPVMTADELIKATENDKRVWDMYANGFTQGLNQCERPKTTERCMTFKPKNIVELCAFVAAIRPGAKSMVDDYVHRKLHTYNIPALDNLLRINGATGNTGKSSFLFYDEQILILGQAAGIEPSRSYSLLKHIKKKHHDQVAAFKDDFIPGFMKYLKEQQKISDEFAKETAEKIWTIIINSASYLFNCSHSYAVGLDSLYGAYLKCYYPFEFYLEMLKHCTEKCDKDKIALIIAEMKKYKGIQLNVGKFGDDNRDWSCDKDANTISQSLSSIKHVSQNVANELYAMKDINFNTFVDYLLYCLDNDSVINKTQRDILIDLGYFSVFGGAKKLHAIVDEFTAGKNRITKTLSGKGREKRLPELYKFESGVPDEDISLEERLLCEAENIGMCISTDLEHVDDEYVVLDVDDKYSPKITMYNIARGTKGTVKCKKTEYVWNKIQPNTILKLISGAKKPVYSYADGKKTKIDGKTEYWMSSWKTIYPEQNAQEAL